jgi:hypothetical protein
VTRLALSIVAAACALVLASTAAVAQKTRWTLKLEGGAELDTNIHRFEVTDDGDDTLVEAAGLSRVGARYRASVRTEDKSLFRFSGYGGLKFFGSEGGQSENVVILSGDGRYTRQLGKRSAYVTARGNYYDAILYNPFDASRVVPGRNFRALTGEGQLTLRGPGAHRLSTSAGYRTFEYKPDSNFDWDGDHYGLQYQTTIWLGDPEKDGDASSLDITAAYQVGRRNYSGSAFTNACGAGAPVDPACFVPTQNGRVDLSHSIAAEIAYTGDRLYSGRYEVQAVDSNSYGQSLVRHRFIVGVTSELLSSKWYLTVKGTEQINQFLDPLILARDVQAQTFVSIDDENRNSVGLHLARDVGEKWTVEAKYSFFSNEFATREVSFRRQTAYLGAVYKFGQ